MPARLQYTASARQDLSDIRAFLKSRASPTIAARVIMRVRRAVAAARQMPDAGTPRSDYGPGCRFVVERPYFIYYDYQSDVMTVLRILHAARDRDAIMGDKSLRAGPAET